MVSNIHDATFSSNTFNFFSFFRPPQQSRVCCFIAPWSVLQCFLSSLWSPFNSRWRLIPFSFFCWGWYSTFMLRWICMPFDNSFFSYSTFLIQNFVAQNFSFPMIKFQSLSQPSPRQQAHTGTQGYNTNCLFALFVIRFLHSNLF